MRQRLKIWIAILGLWLGTADAFAQDRAIYGKDDRLEIDTPGVDRQAVTAARGVAVILPRSSVRNLDVDTRQLNPTPLRDKVNLCPDQSFAEQPAPGLCSGFLISPDLLVTAGHCMRSAAACANTSIVFDFKVVLNRPQLRPEMIDARSVYQCRTILRQVINRAIGIDFALLQLDRPAYDRLPLEYRKTGKIAADSKLTVISHPAGLPLKIATGGSIRDNNHPNYFITDLDTFVGSSGAPVFNQSTGLVEGFVARGDLDWTNTANGCRIYRFCAQQACRGEDVIRMSAVLDYLP